MTSQGVRIAIVVSSVVFAGCSTMGLGGSSEFACPATGGVTCEPVDSVYRMSRNGTLPGKRSGSAPAATPPAGVSTPYLPQQSTPANPPARVPVSTAAAAAAPNRSQALAPMPIRSQPRILRGWIVPYEDADGDLVGDSYVFIPVDGGRWMVEHARNRIRDAYAPARPTAAAATAPAPAATAALADGNSGTRPLSAFPPPDGAPDVETFTAATKQASALKPGAAPGASK